MKFICDRAVLSEALAAASGVILARTPKPILQCVRVSAVGDHLELTAYDQEVGLRYRVREVEINRKGETLVPCDRFIGIVRESTDETLAMELKDDVLHIRGRDSHFQIYGKSVAEFPPVPDMEGDADFTIRADKLREVIEMTAFAAARENTRYAINGVLWRRDGSKLEAVATDGRRLAVAYTEMESIASKDNSDVIVPTKALSLFSKLHLGADEVVSVKLTANQVILRSDRATISSVLVEGRFPSYKDVIPAAVDNKVEIETAEFLSAVRRAALLTNEESKGIRLAVGKDKMVLSSRAPEQGEATVDVPINYTGEPLTVGFNPGFIIDALKVCGETTRLEIQGSGKPGVLRSRENFLYVVMPVNLS